MRTPSLPLVLLLAFAVSTTAAAQDRVQWVEPVVTVTDNVWPEGDGESEGYITLTLSIAQPRDIRINEIAVMPYWWDWRDYPYANISFESGVHVIPAGETEIHIPVHITGNDSYQSKPKVWNGGFDWNNGLPFDDLEAVYGAASLNFTLTEDDPIPLVTVPEDVSIIEGTASPSDGQRTLFWLTFTGSAPVTGRLSVHLQSETATLIRDYDLQYPTAYWQFENKPSLSVAFIIERDAVPEEDETFVVELTPQDMELTRNSIRVTIVNDDAPNPTVTVADTVWPEGDGQTEGYVTLELSHAYPRDIHVTAQLDPAERGWASMHVDPAWHLISAGETALQMKLFISGNDSYQSAEKVFPGTATLWDDALYFTPTVDLSITLTEDDPIATVMAADMDVVEGHGGQTPATLTLTASAPVTGRVFMRLIDETASAYSDYDPSFCCTNPIEFNGQAQVSIPFFIWGDVVPEEDETFIFEFFDPFDLLLERTRARMTIVDDDQIDASAEFSPRDLSLFSGETALLAVRLSPPDAEERMLTLWTANALIHIPPSVIIAPSASATLELAAMTPGIDHLECAGHHIRCDGVPITVLAPVIERIWPVRGSIAGGTEVTIYGEGLSAGCSVSFAEIAATRTTFVSRQMIIATSPPHDAGDADVQLRCGSVELALDDAFRFEVSPPPLGRRRSARH